MAVVAHGRVVAANLLTSGNTQQKALTEAISVGDILVAYTGFGESPSDATTYSFSSIADSQSNSWSRIQSSSTRRGTGIAWCRVTNPLTTSDVITFGFTNNPQVCWTCVHKFTGVSGTADDSATALGTSDTASVSLDVEGDGLATAIVHWPIEFGVTPAVNNDYDEIDNFSHVAQVEYYSILAKNYAGPGTTSPSETLVVSSLWGIAAVALPEADLYGRSQVIFVG